MTREEEISEKLKYYIRWKASMPDRINTLSSNIKELENKNPIFKQRRNKKIAELEQKRKEAIDELNDVNSHIDALYKELNELKINK